MHAENFQKAMLKSNLEHVTTQKNFNYWPLWSIKRSQNRGDYKPREIEQQVGGIEFWKIFEVRSRTEQNLKERKSLVKSIDLREIIRMPDKDAKSWGKTSAVNSSKASGGNDVKVRTGNATEASTAKAVITSFWKGNSAKKRAFTKEVAEKILKKMLSSAVAEIQHMMHSNFNDSIRMKLLTVYMKPTMMIDSAS